MLLLVSRCTNVVGDNQTAPLPARLPAHYEASQSDVTGQSVLTGPPLGHGVRLSRLTGAAFDRRRVAAGHATPTVTPEARLTEGCLRHH